MDNNGRVWGHWSLKRRAVSVKRRGLRTCTWQGSRLVTYLSCSEHWQHYAMHVAVRHQCDRADLVLWGIAPAVVARLAEDGRLLLGEALGVLSCDVPATALYGPHPYSDQIDHVAQTLRELSRHTPEDYTWQI